MIRQLKLKGFGVLLVAAALLPACSSDIANAPEPQTWHVSIEANKPADDALTRGVYFPTNSTTLTSKWDDNQTVEVYNESDELVGTLYASASDDGSTVITGDISGTYTAGTSTLTLYSPSKTVDYSGQTGTLASMSSKDYVQSTITVTAVDGSNGLLATSSAAFTRQVAFTKFSVTPAVHSLQLSAEGQPTITATLDGTAEANDFYIAMPGTGTSTPTFTIIGTTNANVAFTGTRNKLLENGKYYTANMDLLTTPVVTAPTAVSGWRQDGALHDLVNAGSSSGGTMRYYVSTTNTTPNTSDSGWETTVPQASTAGTYYVWYYVQGNTNYQSTAVVGPLSVTVRIPLTIQMNPLWYVAQYNISANSLTMGTSDTQGYNFTWANAMSMFGAQTTSYSDYKIGNKTISNAPSGTKWHLPVAGEIKSILPGDETPGSNSEIVNVWDLGDATGKYLPSNQTVIFGYNSTTKGGIGEASYWKKISNTEVRAIRFLGTDYCSAWIYKREGGWTSSNKGYVRISATLIGDVENNSTAAATAISDAKWVTYTFGNNESKFAVERVFYSNTTGDGTMANYWAATQPNGYTDSRAWCFYYRYTSSNQSFVIHAASNANKNNYFWVRLFRDN